MGKHSMQALKAPFMGKRIASPCAAILKNWGSYFWKDGREGEASHLDLSPLPIQVQCPLDFCRYEHLRTDMSLAWEGLQSLTATVSDHKIMGQFLCGIWPGDDLESIWWHGKLTRDQWGHRDSDRWTTWELLGLERVSQEMNYLNETSRSFARARSSCRGPRSRP